MPEWRIHDLRRSVATGLSNLGVLPIVADRILNHVPKKQKGQVMFVYNRAEFTRERREALELWARHLLQIIGLPNTQVGRPRPEALIRMAAIASAAE